LIHVLQRIEQVLDSLAACPTEIKLSDLASSTDLSISTAHRILGNLVGCRWVERRGPGSYKLGLRLLELGNLVRSRMEVREAAIVGMRELHRSTGQTVSLCVRRGDHIIYVEQVYNEQPGIQIVRAIGGSGPLHLTSAGKLFLAADDISLCRRYADRSGLLPGTANSITSLDRLLQELSLVREEGYAEDNEELELGVRCLGAAVADEAGQTIAVISLTSPADKMQKGWLPQLLHASSTASERLKSASRRRTAAQARIS
jgi:IclR family KDG regulon transcriptional repressor